MIDNTPPDQPVLRVEHLSKSFAGRPALEDVDFSVRSGEIVGVIGRSGAGKTTLLRCLNGAERPDSGHIFVQGRALGGAGEREFQDVRRGIGLVFQDFRLLQSRSVWGNIALSLEICGVPRAERGARIRELIDLVGLTGHERKHPAQLSGGQKQRVGIARALAARPGLLLCDEPTSALDPEATTAILTLLETVNRDLGVTIILISHEMDVIRRLSHRVLVLDHGRIVEDARTDDLLHGTARHTLTRSFLGDDRSDIPPHIQSLLSSGTDAASGNPVIRITTAAHRPSPIVGLHERFGIPAILLHATLQGRFPDAASHQIFLLPEAPQSALDWIAAASNNYEVLGHVPPGP